LRGAAEAKPLIKGGPKRPAAPAYTGPAFPPRLDGAGRPAQLGAKKGRQKTDDLHNVGTAHPRPRGGRGGFPKRAPRGRRTCHDQAVERQRTLGWIWLVIGLVLLIGVGGCLFIGDLVTVK
jgi:hypothetical protein